MLFFFGIFNVEFVLEHQQLWINSDWFGRKRLEFPMFGVRFGGIFPWFCATVRIDINAILSVIAFHICFGGFGLCWFELIAEKWVDWWLFLRRWDMVKVGSHIKICFTWDKGMVHHGQVIKIIIMLSDDMQN